MSYKDIKKQKEKDRERYYWRKEHNICVSCGKNQAMENHTQCSECAEKGKKRSKENYNWFKQHGLYAACGKNPAERNRVYCYECNMKLSETKRKYWESRTVEQKKAISVYHKNWYNERKEKGICVRCGRSTNNNGKTKCNECLAKTNRQQKQKHIQAGIISQEERGNGIYCYRCCKPVENKDEKLCESCKKKATENINKGRLQYLEHHENPFKLLKPFGGKRK